MTRVTRSPDHQVTRLSLVLALALVGAAGSWAAIPTGEEFLDAAPVAEHDHVHAESAEPAEPPKPESPKQLSGMPSAVPALISLQPGEVHSVAVKELSRVAIGNPKIVDINVVSVDELLLQALQPGATNIILWDLNGQHLTNIEVVDHSSEDLEDKLRQMIQEVGLTGVEVKRQEDKIFLTGQVASNDEYGRLDQMLNAYEGQVSNLVSVAPAPPDPLPPLPLSVKLTVQLIEMSRDSTDRIGVDWADRLTFTETTHSAMDLDEGHSQVARLGEAFRLGALSRTGFNPVLNMLITNGKARILAEPKLVASSGKSATTFIGIEVPVITVTSISSGTVSQNIEFKKTGVDLQFQPTVLNDGEAIQLAVNAKVSSIDTVNAITVSGITVPGFRIRQTETEVITKPGDTIFIAGLLQDEERKNLSQVPGAGSIPVLGALFKSTEFVRGKTELIVVITPELTDEPEMTTDRTLAVDQALSGAEVASSVDNPVLRYALLIQERIAKAIRYPQREEESGIGGEVKLRLHMFRDGTLGRAMVAQSSGSDILDSEALKASETQAPYPPFPSDLSQQDLWLDVPVVFRP